MTTTQGTATSGQVPMDHMHMASGMGMYFHTGNTEYILFKQFRVNSNVGMALACLFVIVLTVGFEGLKLLRFYLSEKYSPHEGYHEPEESKPIKQPSETDAVLPKEPKPGIFTLHPCNKGHVVQCLLHVIQLFIGYCLMLIFMTYNIWLCMSVLIGAAIGYFLFGWHRQRIGEKEH